MINLLTAFPTLSLAENIYNQTHCIKISVLFYFGYLLSHFLLY